MIRFLFFILYDKISTCEDYMDYVIKLILDYSNRLMYADKDYIDNIVRYMIKRNNVDYLINDVDISNYIKGDILVSLLANAAYDYEGKRLLFSTCNIDYSAKHLLDELNNEVKLTDFERCFYYNLFVTQTILHEIEHVNQRSNNISNSIERKIISLTETGDYLLGNYDYCPKERYAEIKSWLYLKKSCKDINIRYLNIYILKRIYEELLAGYNNNLEGPLYRYCVLSKIDYPKIKITSSPYIRMYHGLEISEYEYQYVKKLESKKSND